MSPQASSSVPQGDAVSSPSHLRATSGMAMALTPRPASLPHEHSEVLHSPVIPEGRSEPPEVPSVSAGMKRRAPDDDERDSVPPEGYYPSDLHVRNATPRLRRTLHAKQTGFTPVRNNTQVTASCQISPSHRPTIAVLSSHRITDVTNSPRTPSHGEAQAGKKRSWLGRVRSGFASQNTTSSATKPWTLHSTEYIP